MNDAAENLKRFINVEYPLRHEKALRRMGANIVNCAKKYVSVESGTLRDSLKYEVQDGELCVFSDCDYAPYVHQGTGRYNLDKSQNKTWVYQDAQGEWHTTHGQKPNPFLQRAIDENIGNFMEWYSEGWWS